MNRPHKNYPLALAHRRPWLWGLRNQIEPARRPSPYGCRIAASSAKQPSTCPISTGYAGQVASLKASFDSEDWPRYSPPRRRVDQARGHGAVLRLKKKNSTLSSPTGGPL